MFQYEYPSVEDLKILDSETIPYVSSDIIMQDVYKRNSKPSFLNRFIKLREKFNKRKLSIPVDGYIMGKRSE